MIRALWTSVSRTVFLLIMLVLSAGLCRPVWSQDMTVSIVSGSIEEEPASVFLDLLYDSVRLELVDIEPGVAAASASKEVSYDISEPGQIKVIVGGLNQTVIGDGTLAIATFSLLPPARGGDTLMFHGMNGSAASPDADRISVGFAGGSLFLKAAALAHGTPAATVPALLVLACTLAVVATIFPGRRKPAVLALIFCFTFVSSAAGELVAADIDMNGTVTAADLDAFIGSVLGSSVPCYTDIDFSGETDAVDFQLVVNAALGGQIDSDGDGLCDKAEELLGTAADSADTDGDSVTDGMELVYGEDPLVEKAEYVIINEFVTSNQNGLQDEYGDYPDWIELYNADNHAVNLTGWSLTDDADQIDKWTFPDVTLEAGHYLVVFASMG